MNARFIFIGIMLTNLLFVSCRKDDTSDDSGQSEVSVAKNLFDAVRDEVDQQLNLQGTLNGFRDEEYQKVRGGCASISIAPTGTTFPKTITIIFPQGCNTYAGAAVAGTIVINLTGRVRENGTVASFTLADFKYKNFLLSGNYVMTFTGQYSHTTVITDGKVVTPESKVITYTAINTAIQTDGQSTTFKTNPLTFLLDDVYSITTNSEVLNTRGNKFTLSTDEPLIYKVTCQWTTAGKINIREISRPNINVSLDFGDGTCDNKALLKINQLTREITLP